MRKIHWAFVLLSFFFIHCSTFKPPATYTFEKSGVYGESYDVVWSRVIQWFAENGTPIKNMEKESGFIATEQNLSASSYGGYCDCGKNGTYETVSDPVGNFNVLVQRVNDSVRVTVNASYKSVKTMKGLDGKLISTNTITCNSTGKIEQSILSYVRTGS